MKKTLLFLFAFLFFANSDAQNIFKDDFSTYILNQELSGQGLWSNSPIAPNVGIGACLPLSATEPCFGTKVIGQSLSYLNYGSSNSSILLGPVQDGVARAITPIVTVFGLDLGGLLGGAVITEYVFNIPGLGKLSTDAVANLDLPVIIGTVIFSAVFIIVANILVDLLYAVLDPKVRIQ